MNTQQQHWMARQGDVVLTSHVYDDSDTLVPVKAPSGATLVPRDAQLGVVLQAGAVTGHHHHMPGAGAALTRDASGARRLEVADGTEPLDHDEHDTIEVPSGVVAVGIQVEYVPGAVPRQVED